MSKRTQGVRSLQRLVFRGLVFTAFVCLILTALFVSVGRIAVGAAGLYKGNLSTFLETSLKVDVSIGGLQSSWKYFDPIVTVNKLILGSVLEPAVVVERVSFRVSTFLSLIEASPVLTEIDIGGTRLTLAEDEEGRWRVLGLPSSDKPFYFERILDSSAHLESLTITSLDLSLDGRKATYKVSSEEGFPLEVSRKGRVRTVSLPVLLQKLGDQGEAQRIRLLGEYEGDLRVAEDFRASLYLDTTRFSITDFLPEITLKNFRLASADTRGEFWLAYEDQVFSLSGALRSESIEIADGTGRLKVFDHVDARFEIAGSLANEDFQAYFPSIGLGIAGAPLSIHDLNLVVEKSGDSYVLGGNVPKLDLAGLHKSLLGLNKEIDLIPDSTFKALTGVNPRGVLEETTFYLDYSASAPDVKLTSNIRDVKIDAYLGSPAIDALNGFASLHPDRGYIDLNNTDSDLHFTSMFPSSWHFDSTRGRVNYRYQDGVFQLSSSVLELVSEEVSAFGKFHLNLPKGRENKTWGLVVGIRDINLLDAPKYLPNTLSEDLSVWLTGAVLAGRSSESGLIFHGSLYRNAPRIRKVHEIFLKVEGAELDYDANWPPVSELDATVYINNRYIDSDDSAGILMASRVVDAVVTVPVTAAGQADTVVITGKLSGPLSDGIRILNESPLAQTTGHIAEGWSGTGKMRATAHLEIPIGNRKGQEPYADVMVHLGENNLTMSQFDLTAYEIDGDVRYETKTGLSSASFSARLFDEPVVGSIYSLIEDKTGEITVKVDGQVDIEDLYGWSDQALLTRASGILTYESEIHIPYGRFADRSYVEAISNLQGVVIDMPSPLQKVSPETEVDFRYRQTFMDSGFRVGLSLGSQVESAIQVRDGVVTGGRLHFGGNMTGAIGYNRVNVTGSIEHIDYEEWDGFLEALDNVSEVSIESEMTNALDDIVLDVALLDVFSLGLADTKLRITRPERGWLVELVNADLAGTVLAGGGAEPLKVQLDYLRFFADEGKVGQDPFADTDPGEIVAVDFSTRELAVDGVNYGSWKFDFRPGEKGATFENLTAEVKGMSIVDPSRVHWGFENGVHSSTFDGVAQTNDLGSSLKQWGFASSIEGEDFRFASTVNWAGSPAMVDLDRVAGPVHITGNKGRFVQAESGAAALKLLGIFDFNQLAKRFRFDFSDVVDEGYAFDELEGTVVFGEGKFDISEPILISGPGSNFKVGGTVDLVSGKLDNDMIVTLPVGKNLPWYAAYSAIFTGPLAGATVYIAQKVFENQIDQMSSAKYQIGGTIDDPDIQFISIFDDKVRKTENAEASSGG